MSLNNLFNQKIKVVNIGLEQFRDDLLSQNVECIQMQWAIPLYRDKKIEDILSKIMFGEED